MARGRSPAVHVGRVDSVRLPIRQIAKTGHRQAWKTLTGRLLHWLRPEDAGSRSSLPLHPAIFRSGCCCSSPASGLKALDRHSLPVEAQVSSHKWCICGGSTPLAQRFPVLGRGHSHGPVRVKRSVPHVLSYVDQEGFKLFRRPGQTTCEESKADAGKRSGEVMKRPQPWGFRR